MSKNAANALVRRLLAIRLSKTVIMMVPVHQAPDLPSRPVPLHPKRRGSLPYTHHIEPRLEKLTIANSDWLAYLAGYREIVRASGPYARREPS